MGMRVCMPCNHYEYYYSVLPTVLITTVVLCLHTATKKTAVLYKYLYTDNNSSSQYVLPFAET